MSGMTDFVANVKLTAALKSIAEYIENMNKLGSPKTLPAAKHMLAMISVIASETIDEIRKEAA